MFLEITRESAPAATPAVTEAHDEAVLLVACQKGDLQAFRRLFDSHKDRVYSLALYLSCDEATADDITQQTFATVLLQPTKFRGQAKLSTWLYRLAFNLCINEHRHNRKWLPLAVARGKEAMSEQPSQERTLTRNELAQSVRQAIESLKPKLRAAVVLKYLEDLSYQEIAEVLGCSMGTVASRLNRGHKLLARKLVHLRTRLEGDE